LLINPTSSPFEFNEIHYLNVDEEFISIRMISLLYNEKRFLSRGNKNFYKIIKDIRRDETRR